MGKALEQDLAAYVEMLPRLLEEAPGKFVLIHDGQRHEPLFDSFEEAIDEGYRRFKLAPIFVHEIVPIHERAEQERPSIVTCHT